MKIVMQKIFIMESIGDIRSHNNTFGQGAENYLSYASVLILH